MTDNPFGFALPGAQPPDPNDPASMQRFIAQLQEMLGAPSGGPVNWDLARQIALGQLTGSDSMMGMGIIGAQLNIAPGAVGFGSDTGPPPPIGDPAVAPGDRTAVIEALRLADLWLEPVCALPSGIGTPTAWTRSAWIDETLPIWRKLCDPVAGKMVAAMGDLVPDEARSQFGPMQSLVASLGGALFGGQLGSALGSLAGEVLSAGDIGLPLGPAGTAALIPANIAAYGQGLELPDDEVRLYVALREAAHQRLFGHVPWLRGHMLNTVETYAAGIRINREAIEEAVGRIDPGDPESISQLQLDGIFGGDDDPRQQASLNRLETALALVEGWVCQVVDAAATDRLPNVARLGEAFRRRRAAGGPAEQTFAALVGLELRPRRLREATALWAALTTHRGIPGRDGLWGHPDLLPSAGDFADPDAYARAQFDLGDLGDLNSLGLNDPRDAGSGDTGSGDTGHPGYGQDEPGGGTPPA